mgnify:CR=1 FL=1
MPFNGCAFTPNTLKLERISVSILYQLAQNEDKTLIFENYCDFLNYFDSSIQFQLSFLNQSIDISEYQKSIEIPEQQDDFNGIRKEYVAMLKNQLSKGNQFEICFYIES